MKTKRSLSILMTLLLATSCMDELNQEQMSDAKIKSESVNSNDQFMQNGQINIAVVSDIHYMQPGLIKNDGENGLAFQTYLAQDPKLIQYSDEIFAEVITQIKESKPHILLIPGDLTKDGEKISHESMVGFLEELSEANIKVYVVPGNHDINNPEAVEYNGNIATPVNSITPEDFAGYYSPFGYGAALSRDANSLSYVAEPYHGLWILAIDANKYEENTTIATVAGSIKAETMVWIREQMDLAKQQGVTVIGMMHHGLVEHYNGQTSIHPGYVLDNWQATADTLIAAGLNVVFTGHYHANDITHYTSSVGEIYDVETGSLVSTPFPYRMITLKNKELDINTMHVTSIDATFPGGMDFNTYSELFFNGHLDGYFTYVLTQPPLGLPDPVAASVAPLFREAFLAHLTGDEKISPQQRAMNEMVGQQSPMGGAVLSAFWTDINTKDNKWHFKIR